MVLWMGTRYFWIQYQEILIEAELCTQIVVFGIDEDESSIYGRRGRGCGLLC